MRQRFVARIRENIEDDPHAVREVPGAAAPIAGLRAMAGCRLAIATGGWRETALLKLQAAGIDLEGIALASSPDAHPRAESVYDAANARIIKAGFENLDFAGNLGHSIERTREDRRYLESGSATCLGGVSPFTFEPHIRRRSHGRWGFKHENIDMFDAAGVLVEV